MTGTLWVDGLARTVREVEFTIVLAFDAWLADGGVVPVSESYVTYVVTIDVDERSGEDGAAQPVIGALPVFEAAGRRHPQLFELPGLRVSAPDADWEAWFGNDAPALDENVFTFGNWIDATRIAVLWTARSEHGADAFLEEHGAEPGTLRFEGVARFTGFEAIDFDVAANRETGGPDAMVRAIYRDEGLTVLERSSAEPTVRDDMPGKEIRLVSYAPLV